MEEKKETRGSENSGEGLVNRESGPAAPLGRKPMSRRQFIKVAGITGAAMGLGSFGGVLAGCGGDEASTTTEAGTGTTGAPSGATGREIKIGFVTPLTGPLAGFGVPDQYCVERWQEASADGIMVGEVTHPVTFLVRDSQSDPNRAAQVAGDLINNDGIDLMLVASTPDTVNPVADQCEAMGMPCISNDTPWQPYFFGRGGTPDAGFKWTYHFFWGLEDVIEVFTDMWGQLDTNMVVGGLFPNDPDGNAWGDEETGLPPALANKGFTLIDPGRYQNGNDDFTAQITAFKNGDAELVTGVMIPPDFVTFWKQAKQQNFNPKLASVGKALLFPESLEAIGEIGYGLTSEVWWTPMHPFKSSLTGESCEELAAEYTTRTGNQWSQPLLHYAVYEVAVDALSRTEDIDDKESIIAAIAATDMETIAGPVAWTGDPVPNVSKTPLVGGQWIRGEEYPYSLEIVSNAAAPMVETTAQVKPLSEFA
ncbi:MAG: ABC transporter substrate-binding protein [Thermoleophilia bacterium]